LMGAVLYFQAVSVYLSDEKIGPSVDNTTVVEGKGTNMEHHWDEAFGYLGVPKDFPANQTGIRYWAKYITARNGLLGSNEKIMNAFIKGRAAISNKDMVTKDQCVATIRDEWEKAAAATAISYLNGAKKDFADDSKRNHQLSEAYAFVLSLKYNPTRKITLAQIDEVLAHLGSNYYDITTANIDAARDQLSTIYGFDSIKNTL
jgi:hypothetical protein